MTFSDSAMQLCGHTALLLGWRPAEFWEATPAELGCVLSRFGGQSEPPPDSGDIQKLMMQFPDG